MPRHVCGCDVAQVQVLQACTALVTIQLGSNNIGDEGVIALSEALQYSIKAKDGRCGAHV
jgi:hypothetical protein